MINFSLFQGNHIIYTQRSHKNSWMTEQNPYRAPQIKYNHAGRSWNSPQREHALGRLLRILLEKTPSLENMPVSQLRQGDEAPRWRAPAAAGITAWGGLS